MTCGQRRVARAPHLLKSRHELFAGVARRLTGLSPTSSPCRRRGFACAG